METLKKIVFSTLFLTLSLASYCAVNQAKSPTSSNLSLLEHLNIAPAIKYSHDCFYSGPETTKQLHRQPYIVKFSWDNVTLRASSGKIHSFGSKVGTKGDMILWSDGFKAWNWKEDGTSHNPGITGMGLENLLSLLGKKLPDVIILTRGVEGVLQTNGKNLTDAINSVHAFAEIKLETVDHIKNFLNQKAHRECTIIRSLKSFDAVILYNALVNQGKSVAMLLHTTC